MRCLPASAEMTPLSASNDVLMSLPSFNRASASTRAPAGGSGASKALCPVLACPVENTNAKETRFNARCPLHTRSRRKTHAFRAGKVHEVEAADFGQLLAVVFEQQLRHHQSHKSGASTSTSTSTSTSASASASASASTTQSQRLF